MCGEGWLINKQEKFQESLFWLSCNLKKIETVLLQ